MMGGCPRQTKGHTGQGWEVGKVLQWPELGGNQEQLGWLEPQAQGTERQAVSRRGPGSEACGNVRRRRESEGRKVEE